MAMITLPMFSARKKEKNALSTNPNPKSTG